jgi:hypothetical protein
MAASPELTKYLLMERDLFPHGNAGTQFIDDARDFVSWNAGILYSGPSAFFREHVTVANTRQTPQACTLMRTCPRSGLGISRSTISKSGPQPDEVLIRIESAGVGVWNAFEPSQAVIAKLNRFIEAGPFEVHIARTFPLDRAAEAHRALDDHYLDKLALRFS